MTTQELAIIYSGVSPHAVVDSASIIAILPHMTRHKKSWKVFTTKASYLVAPDMGEALIDMVHNDRDHTFRATIENDPLGIVRISGITAVVPDGNEPLLIMTSGQAYHLGKLLAEGLLAHLQECVNSKKTKNFRD